MDLVNAFELEGVRIMTGPRTPTALTVMEATTAAPDGTTRYIDQVVTFASPHTTFVYFSWTAALQGRYDVLHIHWPELLVRHRSRLKRFTASVLLLLLLIALKIRRIPIVRTLHNLQPHEEGAALERFVLRVLDRATSHFVTINPVTRAPHGIETYIPHGHYRDRFAPHERSESEVGTLVYAGLIRPYKGIERLVASYSARPEGAAAKLRIVGKPTPELRAYIEDAISCDSSISAVLEFVPDAELVKEMTRAELVCLPYDELHNSGMALVALSLDRPLLVPETDTTRALANEVGPGWLHLFPSPLTADHLAAALEQNRAAASTRSARPILDDRDWERVSARYERVFRAAVARR